MDDGAKTKNFITQWYPKSSSLKNWKGREEGEDPGKGGKRR